MYIVYVYVYCMCILYMYIVYVYVYCMCILYMYIFYVLCSTFFLDHGIKNTLQTTDVQQQIYIYIYMRNVQKKIT